VPLGYWPVIIRDDIGFNAAGIHLDRDGQPFALVEMSDSWSLTASHEVLEMLADPFGNRLVAGKGIKQGQPRVEYLVEVCDPSEAAEFGYTVNGILVSDFYTPRYFDPVKASGVRYSFTGAIKKPREVLKGGYLSWRDPKTGHWWQQNWFGTKKTYTDLGVFSTVQGSLRSMIDQRTKVPQASGLPRSSAVLRAAVGEGRASAPVTQSKADAWHEQIEALKQGAPA
jgi:hypothetical protein